ncbi:MAG: hypothetical protein QGG01_02820 [Roseibacillus sp.]|nr:hypothetical protein [Roseibacillus sp.]
MEDLTKVLVDTCNKEGLDPSNIKYSDAALHAKLYPRLIERCSEWEGLENNIQWVGSRAFSHFKGHLKNCLGVKGAVLAKKLTPKKEVVTLPFDSDSDDQVEEDTQKPTVMNTRGKKRAAPATDAADQETTPAPAAKRQKLGQPEQQTPSAPAKGAANKANEILAVKSLTRDEKVAEIKLVAENIRLQKRQLNTLYKAWRVLRADLYPEIDDPMADLK